MKNKHGSVNIARQCQIVETALNFLAHHIGTAQEISTPSENKDKPDVEFITQTAQKLRDLRYTCYDQRDALNSVTQCTLVAAAREESNFLAQIQHIEEILEGCTDSQQAYVVEKLHGIHGIDDFDKILFSARIISTQAVSALGA